MTDPNTVENVKAVYLLQKHERQFVFHGEYLESAIVVGAYSDRQTPANIAKKRNAGRSSYLWTVKRVNIKGASDD